MKNTMRLDQMRLVPMMGSGSARLSRHLGSVLLSSVDSEPVGTAALVELCADHAASGLAPSALIERVTGLLIRSPEGSLPPFVLLVQADDGLRAVINGSVHMTVDGGGEPSRALTGDTASWTSTTITAGAYVSATLVDCKLTAIDQLVDLRRGIVRASGFVLIGLDAESRSAPQSGTDAEEPLVAVEAPDPTFSIVDLRQPMPPSAADAPVIAPLGTIAPPVRPAPVPEPEPTALPLVKETPEHESHARVEGLVCARGHFNDPRAQFCAACGIQMGQVSFVLVEGDRPPLGVLIFDNGVSHALSTDLVIGRMPSDDPQIRAGRARALTLVGEAGGLSRVHADVRLVGWDVHLVDRGSTNGTFVWDEALNTWQRLQPDIPFVLRPGAQLAFGPRTAVYESSLRTGRF